MMSPTYFNIVQTSILTASNYPSRQQHYGLTQLRRQSTSKPADVYKAISTRSRGQQQQQIQHTTNNNNRNDAELRWEKLFTGPPQARHFTKLGFFLKNVK